jgi:hypothetical protein
MVVVRSARSRQSCSNVSQPPESGGHPGFGASPVRGPDRPAPERTLIRGRRGQERKRARAESRPDSPFRVCTLLLIGEILLVIQSTNRARQAQLQSVTSRKDQLSCSDSRMAAAIRKQSNASLCHKRAHPGSAVSAACSRQSRARSRNRSPRSPATSIPPCIRSSSLQPGHESQVFLPRRSSEVVKFWTRGGLRCGGTRRSPGAGQGSGE